MKFQRGNQIYNTTVHFYAHSVNLKLTRGSVDALLEVWKDVLDNPNPSELGRVFKFDTEGGGEVWIDTIKITTITVDPK